MIHICLLFPNNDDKTYLRADCSDLRMKVLVDDVALQTAANHCFTPKLWPEHPSAMMELSWEDKLCSWPLQRRKENKNIKDAFPASGNIKINRRML